MGAFQTHYRGRSLDGQEWREIPGTNGTYYINETGTVKRRYVKAIYLQDGILRRVYFRELTPSVGYGRKLKVTLCLNGEAKTYSVHRLVATAFVPNPYNLSYVRFRDGNSANINPKNLVWFGKIF